MRASSLFVAACFALLALAVVRAAEDTPCGYPIHHPANSCPYPQLCCYTKLNRFALNFTCSDAGVDGATCFRSDLPAEEAELLAQEQPEEEEERVESTGTPCGYPIHHPLHNCPAPQYCCSQQVNRFVANYTCSDVEIENARCWRSGAEKAEEEEELAVEDDSSKDTPCGYPLHHPASSCSYPQLCCFTKVNRFFLNFTCSDANVDGATCFRSDKPAPSEKQDEMLQAQKSAVGTPCGYPIHHPANNCPAPQYCCSQQVNRFVANYTCSDVEIENARCWRSDADDEKTEDEAEVILEKEEELAAEDDSPKDTPCGYPLHRPLHSCSYPQLCCFTKVNRFFLNFTCSDASVDGATCFRSDMPANDPARPGPVENKDLGIDNQAKDDYAPATSCGRQYIIGPGKFCPDPQYCCLHFNDSKVDNSKCSDSKIETDNWSCYRQRDIDDYNKAHNNSNNDNGNNDGNNVPNPATPCGPHFVGPVLHSCPDPQYCCMKGLNGLSAQNYTCSATQIKGDDWTCYRWKDVHPPNGPSELAVSDASEDEEVAHETHEDRRVRARFVEDN